MDKNIKGKVKSYYGGIAKKMSSNSKASCGCGSACCGSVSNNSNIYTKEYIEGLPEEAVNASLGCANPVVLAAFKKGETVLDLGSGGGIDAFISSKYVGGEGKVYGLDMTGEMLELANENKEKMGVSNVEFIKGYIEDIPLEDETIDVITSNCVINLCEDKDVALREAYRVLKQGGRLAIADIVQLKEVPEDIRQSAEMWVGCIAGALDIKIYENILKKVGFREVEITPVNLYTKEIIEDIAKQKNLGNVYSKIDADLLDGAYAGAHVKAYKYVRYMDYIVREAKLLDIPYITKIYNQGIEDRIATLETRLRDNAEMEEWLNSRGERYKVIVIEDSQGIVRGWASINIFNSRCAYSGVGDLSIYVERDMRGKGLGKILLADLLDIAKKQDFHKLVLSTFEFNNAGKSLYKTLGFREVGTYENQGILDGKFVNITIMEKLL